MHIGLFIFIICGFIIFNIYHDGKYTNMLKSWKKYYQMGFIGFLGLSIYIFSKKHPAHSKSLLIHANDLIKYAPIDKNTANLLNPIFDLTKNSNFSYDQYNNTNTDNNISNKNTNIQHPSSNINVKGPTKRSVSETKKKFVASSQNWKCGKCTKQLTAWFEVDHKTRLEYGGSNEVSNLIALCRECHGEKTTMENL